MSNTSITTKRVKRWQRLRQSKSNLTFLCDGLLMFGPNFTHMCLTNCLVIASWSGSIFLLLPQLQIKSLWLTVVTPLVLLFLNEAFLLSAAMTDPGFLPPDTKVSDIDHKENMALFRTNYCSICRIVKPPRARHCRICGMCVLAVDHHCPWLGVCVGVRNYIYFFLFVFTCGIGCAFNVIASVILLLGWFQKYATTTPVLRAVTGICGLLWFAFAFALIVTLLSFHIFLMFRGQTTVEYLKEAHINLSTKSMHTGSASSRLLQPPPETLRLDGVHPGEASGVCKACPIFAVPVYGCCTPPSRLMPLWQYTKDEDDEEEDERREALLRRLEEAIMVQLEAEDEAEAEGQKLGVGIELVNTGTNAV